MDMQRAWHILIGSTVALFLAGVMYIVIDARGPIYQASGTVVAMRYSEGAQTTTQIEVGSGAHVPITTTIPGAWIAVIDSPLLGRQELALDEASLRVGQLVYLDYRIGRLSKEPGVVDWHLEPRMFQ